MIKKDLETCCNAEFSYYRCEFANECEFGTKPDNCAYDHQKTVQHTEVLRKDCQEQGYTIFGIEAHAVNLSESNDCDVAGEDLQVGSWMDIRGDKKVNPLVLEEQDIPSYQLRSSELGSRCMIGGLASKARPEYKARFPLDATSYAGTAAHEICNDQHRQDYAHNKSWERIGIEPITRDKYCERSISYVYQGIRVKGKADALFRLGDDVIVFDFKRALAYAYESPKIKMQLLSYACAVGADASFLITSKRAYPADKKGFKRLPRYMITRPSKRMLDSLHEDIKIRYEFQKRCLENPRFFLKEFSRNKSCRRGDMTCFNINICSDLAERVKRGDALKDYLLEGVEL